MSKRPYNDNNVNYRHIVKEKKATPMRLSRFLNKNAVNPRTKKHRYRHYIAEWRKATPGSEPGKCMSQEQASAAIGYDGHSALAKIETGVSPYTQDTLEALAELYNCSIFDLLFRHPNHVTNKKPETIYQRLLKILDNVPGLT